MISWAARRRAAVQISSRSLDGRRGQPVAAPAFGEAVGRQSDRLPPANQLTWAAEPSSTA